MRRSRALSRLGRIGAFLGVLSAAPARAQAGAEARAEDPETFFELKVRPVLSGTCFRCHGGEKVSHGLRVDSREALLKGGERGAALVPGDPERSLLVRAVRREDPDLRMPPDEPLSPEVVADLARWVKDGAAWPGPSPRTGAGGGAAGRHWAFQPLRDVEPPGDPSGWSEGPLDRFILKKLRQEGLTPLGRADPRTLLRRVSFDLTGLPPSPEEAETFLGDGSPEAYSRLVDRLLASPRYGERWGRHWMDVVRYADTAGDNADYPIPEVRLYRDYIIDSLNADKPYDRFVREQLAGDILAGEGPAASYAERVAATGFIALSRRYGTAPGELWHLTIEDTIETTGRAFLGLTLRCARCHDHKFDPLTARDYYALYGIFASTRYPYAGSEEFQSKGFPRSGFAPLLPPAESAPLIAAHRSRIEALEGELKALEKEKETGKPEKLKKLKEELRDLQRPGLPPGLAGAYAVAEGQPGDAPLQVRGDPAQSGQPVPRGVPAFLSGGRPLEIGAAGSGRVELARWLTRPDHPLTARVMANRIWQHHFGKGIVESPSNFGLRGEEPSHPELLDWLAARFIESGWSLKAMHRLIVLSRTYQLSSGHDEANAAKDPANRWCWRHDRLRLDAESIRDAMLFASGKLDLARPGPHPFPPITSWSWTQHSPFKAVYASPHRSVYLMTQRIQRHPYLALFDGADTNSSTDVRTSATVPLQALYLMNNPFVREAAQGLARRVLLVSPEPNGRIALAHRLAWSRPPDPVEAERGRRYLESCERELLRAGAAPEEVELEAWTSYARVLFSANEFVYLD